jgi:hypothetical protein
MAIVGSRPGGGSWKSISRLATREPRMSQQAIPMPKLVHARPVSPKAAAPCAPIKPPATVGRKYPG